jgi:rhodanese-related sulfurtransferase
MSAVLEVYPGAQRALFRQYHIGGCNNCGFRPDETLADVCARNGGLIVAEVLENIRASHEQDERVLIAPADLAAWLQREPGLRLVDIRSREEFEAVHIKGSELLSQEAMRRIMSDGSNDRPLVIIDHRGAQSLDAAAYFAGHGLRSVRCLRGGIDAWSREVDPKLPRYQYAVQPAAA